MYSFESRVKFQSSVCPGITATIRRLSQARAAAVALVTAEYRKRLAELARRFEEVRPDFGQANGEKCETCGHVQLAREGDPPDVLARKGTEIAALNREAAVVESAHLLPAMIREYVQSVEGLEIDGQPATVDTLLSDGPEDLVRELYEFIGKRAGLSPEERKNSESPSTSGTAADGSATNTIAGGVSES